MCAAAKVPCIEFFFSDSGLKYAISRQEYSENLQKSSQICYKHKGILRFLASQICYFRTDIGGSFPGPGIRAVIRRGDGICAEERGGGLMTGMRSCIANTCST